MQDLWRSRRTCRACGAAALDPVHDFGPTPLSDRIQPAPESRAPSPRVPLTLCHCSACGMSQLSVDVVAEVLFSADYPYYSSVSPALSAHFEGAAQKIIADRGIGPGSTVVEIASNDGCMLRHFRTAGARVLGLDPAKGPAARANADGVETRTVFFTEALARALRAEGVVADVILANNVLAHVPDPLGLARGIAEVLAPDGIGVIEVPYLVDLMARGAFDTIYHQHACYVLLAPLSRMFGAVGLRIAGVERIAIHGGSLRLTLTRGAGDAPEVAEMIGAEEAAGQT
ncbi:MAG: class I SAM-dependent methyltransferase, partial [Pseudomonadota bacterium]